MCFVAAAALGRYKFRILVDETLSFGVLGKSGRGVTEHYGLPVTCVDVLLGSNATALAGVGGFCVGSHEVCSNSSCGIVRHCSAACV